MAINISANAEDGAFRKGNISVKILNKDAVVADQLRLLRDKEAILVVDDGRQFNVEIGAFAMFHEGSSTIMNATISSARTAG